MADPVELLLSAEMYSVILQEDLRKGAPQAPVAQRMLLRWILSGECGDNSTVILRFLQCTVNHELNALMQCSWEQERETPAALTQRSNPVRSFLKLTRIQLSAGTLCALCLSINSQGHVSQQNNCCSPWNKDVGSSIQSGTSIATSWKSMRN